MQRNELFKSIEKSGLKLVECDLTQIREPGPSIIIPGRNFRGMFRSRAEERSILGPDRQVARITHIPSSSTFTIEASVLGFGDLSFVSYLGKVGGQERLAGIGWRDSVKAVCKWAEEVKREFVDPDLWAELRLGKEFLTRAQHPKYVNTPFTSSEQETFNERLAEIYEEVRSSHSLSIEQEEELQEIFEVVKDASHRLGRKDWVLLFGGALASLLVTAVVPPEVVQHIFIATVHSLGHLFSSEPPPQLP